MEYYFMILNDNLLDEHLLIEHAQYMVLGEL